MNSDRVALVTNVMSHYRIPGLNKLASIIGKNVNFYFLTRIMPHRNIVMSREQSEIRPIWLKGWKWRQPPRDDRHINDIRPIIKKNYQIVVLGGWDEPTYWILWLWRYLAKGKVIFWIESTLSETPRRGIKEVLKKLLLSKASACIVPGQRAHAYCKFLGMPEEKIFAAPNATDRDYFKSKAKELQPERQQIRKELGLSGVVLLFVGRLVEAYKNLSFLLKSFEKLNKSDDKVTLLIVGDGPDRKFYEAMVERRNIAGVRFLGEMNHDELCRIYAASDIMVLPSRSETWGFVLNEAMEFGLPLVVSEAVGAGPDLVHHGKNGFIVPLGDEDMLTKALTRLVQDKSLRTAMGTASRRIIQRFSPENWAEGVLAAIRFVSGDSH